MDERLRLDYEQTSQLLRTLIDVRFKLLALVPTISGIAVAVVGHGRPAAELLGVGTIGLVATAGILLYDTHNTQIYDRALERARELETRLELTGGSFTDRRDGLALVYAAAVGAWTYLVGWGALRALSVGSAQKVGAAIAVVVGALVVYTLWRREEAGSAVPAATPSTH